MEQITFGLFDWVDRGQRPLDQLYEERLTLIEQADRAGFYGYHLAEHHATPLGMAPSPALFLSSVAQRTRNIRLGPLGYLLPIYNPLRLIEEICMLDQLSKGRLDLGVGRGVSPYELQHFGVDSQNTRAIFDEGMEILVQGLSQPRLNFQGQYYQYDNVPMELEPLQKPYPPMWYPTHNPESISYVARHGYNFVGLGPASVVAQNADEYRKIWQQHIDDPHRLNGHVLEPKIGIVRQILVADTDSAAEASVSATMKSSRVETLLPIATDPQSTSRPDSNSVVYCIASCVVQAIKHTNCSNALESPIPRGDHSKWQLSWSAAIC